MKIAGHSSKLKGGKEWKPDSKDSEKVPKHIL